MPVTIHLDHVCPWRPPHEYDKGLGRVLCIVVAPAKKAYEFLLLTNHDGYWRRLVYPYNAIATDGMTVIAWYDNSSPAYVGAASLAVWDIWTVLKAGAQDPYECFKNVWHHAIANGSH
jgi:hypothetical protein